MNEPKGVPHEVSVVVASGLSDVIPRETMLGYFKTHVEGLPQEHLDTVTDFVNSQRSWLNEMSSIINAERERRNPKPTNRWDVV